MEGSSESSIDHEAVQAETFPDGLTPGTTVLIAGAVEPTTYAVGLRALDHYGHADDAALVVTTTKSVDETLDMYETVCADSDRPSLGLVDMISEQQSVSAVYGDAPVVFVPSPSDLERLVLALSELTGDRPPSNGTRHLVVRSLTPLLKNASTPHVYTVLDRISGLRSGEGLSLLCLDYTAHDDETMAALIERVDGVLWITEVSENHLEFEFRPMSGQQNPSMMSTDGDD